MDDEELKRSAYEIYEEIHEMLQDMPFGAAVFIIKKLLDDARVSYPELYNKVIMAYEESKE